jgi:hypothetical protein
MLGFGRSVSVGLAGWLWADLLLGLFAIFLAANAVSPAAINRIGVDPKPLEIRLSVNGAALLSSVPATVSQEQQRIASALQAQLRQVAPGRKVAIVFAYGSHERAAEGDRMATVASATLKDGLFAGAAVRPYHELIAGDQGSAIAFEIYFDE